MVAPTITAALTSTELDEFAATLADLASAVDRRDGADVLTHLHDIGLHDPDAAAVLGDFLTFAGLFEEVTR
jgi:hypothetical protein